MTTGRFDATIKAADSDGGYEWGEFDAIMSTPSLDRDGEVIDTLAFEPLPDHIMIDVDHAMSVEKTIGSGAPYYDESGILKIKGRYASTPLGQTVRSLVNEGHIRTMSVAYMNARTEIDSKDNRPHVRQAELLNAGIVGIPANRDALITSSKAATADDSQSSTPNPDEVAAVPAATSPAEDVVKAAQAASVVAAAALALHA